jgi:hypothetical protein
MGENAISTIKMLRREDVWHPRVGAPRGNRNALKNGHYTREARALRTRLCHAHACARLMIRAAEA